MEGGIIAGIIVAVVVVTVLGIVFFTIGENYGRKAAQREITRRVLLNMDMADADKIVILTINDNALYDREEIK